MRRFLPLFFGVSLLPFVAQGQSLTISPYPLADGVAQEKSEPVVEPITQVIEDAQARPETQNRPQARPQPKKIVKVVEVVEPRYSDEQVRAMALRQLNYEPPAPIVVDAPAPRPIPEPEITLAPEPIVEIREEVRKGPRFIAFVDDEDSVVEAVTADAPLPVTSRVQPTVESVSRPIALVAQDELEPLEGNPYGVYKERVKEARSVERSVDAIIAQDVARYDGALSALDNTAEQVRRSPVEYAVAKVERRRDVVPQPELQPEPQPQPQIIKIEAPQSEWNARTGNTLRSVLGLWSEREGVEVVWQAAYDYKILENYDSADSYASAVAGLLDRYVDASVRPIGHLQIDPQSDRKRLTIFTASGE